MLRRIIQSRIAPDMILSELHNQNTFYKSFIRDIRICRSELIIESPFITQKRINLLLPSLERALRRGVSITINTKPPTEHDAFFFAESEIVIPMLQDLGINILFTGGHHRKLAIIDRRVLWEGSLNILSQSESCEVMRRIESELLSQQMFNFVGLDRYVG